MVHGIATGFSGLVGVDALYLADVRLVAEIRQSEDVSPDLGMVAADDEASVPWAAIAMLAPPFSHAAVKW